MQRLPKYGTYGRVSSERDVEESKWNDPQFWTVLCSAPPIVNQINHVLRIGRKPDHNHKTCVRRCAIKALDEEILLPGRGGAGIYSKVE